VENGYFTTCKKNIVGTVFSCGVVIVVRPWTEHWCSSVLWNIIVFRMCVV